MREQYSADVKVLDDVLYGAEWDTLTAADFRTSHPAARLCPLCSAWVWNEEKHRDWHLALVKRREMK